MATQQQIDDLFAKLTRERDGLLAAVRDIDEAEASTGKPDADGEAGWSVKQQLAHLAQMDRSYRSWIRRAIAEDRPDVSDGRTAIEPLAHPMERAADATVDQLVQQMNEERAETLELARGFGPEQFDRTARQQTFGELSVLQWLRSYYRHDRMHHAQILGEESDYQPRYASGQREPRP